MKNYMKKSCIMSSLICIITLFSYIYASCVLGANKMGGENEYIVTINGIEMYSGAAIELLERIIREEKEIVNIVDKNMGRTLDVTEEILKPEVNILIDNSKNVAGVSELFKKAKTCIIESKDVLDSKTATEDKGISITKLGNIFSVSDSDDINNRIILFVNNRFQITKMRIFRNDSPSKVQSAIPVPE